MANANGIIDRILEAAPDYSEFMLVRELYESSRSLAREYSDVAEIVEAGESRAELPVEALVIHGGEDRVVLAYGFPHPNEPVGSLTLEALSRILLARRDLLRELNATWVIVKVADVYGALLNEGWFKGPFSLEKYFLNYYRPPPYKQVEWTFPVKYKTLEWDKPTPETKALMRLIEEWRPTHIYSLHNSHYTGTFYYISREPPPDVLETLTGIPARYRVPLHKGAPEAPYIKRYAKGVYGMYSIADEYDWLEKYSSRDPAEILVVGDNSYGYARRLNPDVLAMICEVPYIYDDRLDNETRIGMPLREIYRVSTWKGRRNFEEMKDFAERMEPHISGDNPFYEPLKYHIGFVEKYIEAEEDWLERDPRLDRQATVAEALHAYTITLWEVMAFYGRAYRVLAHEESRGARIPEELKSEALRRLRSYLEVFERAVEYRVIPPGNLVRIQLAAIVSTVTGIQV